MDRHRRETLLPVCGRYVGSVNLIRGAGLGIHPAARSRVGLLVTRSWMKMASALWESHVKSFSVRIHIDSEPASTRLSP